MSLTLGIPGYTFADLHDPRRLRELDSEFVRELDGADPELSTLLKSGRSDPDSMSPLQLSDFLVRLAPRLSDFLCRLFPIGDGLNALRRRASEEAVLSRFKRDFLVRRAAKAPLPNGWESADFSSTAKDLRQFERTAFPELPWNDDEELATARMAVALLELESPYVELPNHKKRPVSSPDVRAHPP